MNKITKPQIVQITTSDNLYLQGFFVPREDKSALLHIHGFEGNFYENRFVQKIAELAQKEGLTFLTVNTRGCEKIKDFNTPSGQIKTIGARYELIEESPIDIDAWIEFLSEQGFDEIILSGHSLGTYKAVRYLSEGKYKEKIKKLILLSPFDKKGFLISSGREPVEKLLEEAQKMIDIGKGDEMVTDRFEEIVLSYKTYVSWYKQDDLGRMFEFCTKDYDFPALKRINVPTKIIVGSKDEFFYTTNPEHPEEAMGILLKNIPNSEGKLIEGSVHSFAPHEDELVKEVVEFVKK